MNDFKVKVLYKGQYIENFTVLAKEKEYEVVEYIRYYMKTLHPRKKKYAYDITKIKQ